MLERLSRLSVALCLLVSLEGPARAADRGAADAETDSVSYQDVFVPLGLALGQRIRYSLFMPGGTPVKAQLKLYDQGNGVLAESVAGIVEPGQLRVFDLPYEAVVSRKATATGRMQVRAVGHFQTLSPRPVDLGEVHSSVEVIDATTNRTVHAIAHRLSSRSRAAEPGTTLVEEHLIGLVPGQSLRLSAANPLPPVPVPGASVHASQVLASVHVFDAAGNVVAERPDVLIGPEGFHTFEFDRSSLALLEEGAGRGQARTRIRYRFFSIVDRTNMSPTTLELVDGGGMGQTGLLLPAVQIWRCPSNPNRECILTTVPNR